MAFFTQNGLVELQNKLKHAEMKRPQVLESLKRAREMGDLSENGAYKGARFELSRIDSEIRHLKRLISSARIIEKASDNNTVRIGHTVVLKRIS